ncbi:MAG TPA: patatin-like phospholipase family protein [Planctomycetia bacterium]|nr:patatin-like phospholipase family protein [Planctomycetia bacterium]
MHRRLSWNAATAVLFCATLLLPVGCRGLQHGADPSPAAAGMNVRDVVDPEAQAEGEFAIGVGRYLESTLQAGARIRAEAVKEAPANRPPRNVLCLSGGGSTGAFTCGVLSGWTARGDRPVFDVVTGVSTGALIAPFAFLGPQYDSQLAEFYTNSRNRDIFRTRYLRGLMGGESFLNTAPLRTRIASFMTCERMAEIAEAHRAGRRLIIGTTEMEGKRFVMWDVGAIACGGRATDRELIIDVMLGSAAIPGVFPAAKIDVCVDGKRLTERHVDGGVSRALFFYSPYVPPEQRTGRCCDLVGTNVYAIVAGKLFADPEVIRPTAVSQAAKAVFTLTFAQTRSDLERLWTFCLLNGMTYNLTAIPPEYPRPQWSGEFKPDEMSYLYETGRRVGESADGWRTTPPGMDAAQGELDLARDGRTLTHQPRGPETPIRAPRRRQVIPNSPGARPSASGSAPAVTVVPVDGPILNPAP